jgi:phage baseplate assembly protein V
MSAFIKRKIDNLLTRAVLTLINQDETKGKILVQVLGMAGEVRSDIEHLQQYGLKSIPLPGSRGLLVCYGGNKDNGTVINVDDKRYGQFSLQPGDVCLYSKNGAHTIYRGDDIIEILDGTKTITIGSMIATFSSTGLNIVGDITATGEITAKTTGTAIPLSTHKHTGSPTAPTGAVSPTGSPTP